MSFEVTSPVKSPSLGEVSQAFFEDENEYNIPVIAVVQPDADGNSGLADQVIEDGQFSQVTARRDAPQVTLPDENGKAQVFALMSMDADGNLIPFQAGAAAVAALASKLTGKFQSAERTATGSAESIAHGLGVAPTMVLVSVQDTNGVALPHAIVEGSHTSTNVVVTVTASLKYKVIAFA